MALNKGEWSEVYVFLKLLAEGKLYAADGDLNRSTVFYPLVAILREILRFEPGEDVKIYDSTGSSLMSVPVADFSANADLLLNSIKSTVGSSFNVSTIEAFMRSIGITSLKAKSGDKKDINIIVHDPYTGMTPTLGFSIKSKLGNASTLLNASKGTNFTYKIFPELSLPLIDEINAIDTRNKIQNRIQAIYAQAVVLNFSTAESPFMENLILVDSSLPLIVSEMLKIYYSSNISAVADLTEAVRQLNPCGYDLAAGHPFYEYKVKNFLTDVALGMKPRSTWNGTYDANGGYIIVKEDGDIVCYHIYNRNEFQKYLFCNTRFDTPSSSRNDFGYIYSSETEQFFNLNLQIRFK